MSTDRRVEVMTVQCVSQAPRAGRMLPLARLPVFFALDGRRAVVAGGTAAAAWKAELLSAAGANVDVYAEKVSDALRGVAAEPPRGRIVLYRRGWRTEDLPNAAIAVGAFEDDTEAGVFAEAAGAAGVCVNVIDKPAFCDFAFGAIVNRSPLVIGISTDGAAPAFAQAIRAKLETLLPHGFAVWATAAQSWRAAVKAAGLTTAARQKFWQLFAARAVIDAGRTPAQADFDGLMAEVRSYGPAVAHGSVVQVRVDSGDPEMLTLKAVRLIRSADIILFDERVPDAILDFARREARKLLVGNAGNEADVDMLMRRLARQRKRVVRLCVEGEAAVLESKTACGQHTILSAPAVANSSAARNGGGA
jgi:uroporphyrin-III C-methyltransferase / precorrin-2 dehydrogenase / sirohydrochlorin ferrochelatase